VARIVWATLRAVRQPYLPMNAELWAAAAAHPELSVADWNTYSRSHPDWFQNDGIHLTRRGGIALAGFLHAQLASRTTPTIAQPAGRLPSAAVGRRYDTRVVARDGRPPYRWAIVWGSPPRGLRLTPGGTLKGVPRQAGAFSFVLRVVDADQGTALRRTTLAVHDA
jgi:hypothetical protein